VVFCFHVGDGYMKGRYVRLDSEKVRWHRDRLGWTLDTLAEQAEVAEGTALRAEHGEDIRPSSGRRIARAFGVDISELVPEKPGVILPKAEAPSTPGQPERTEDKPFTSRSRSFLLPAQEPHERAMTSETQLASDLETIEAAAARALSRVEDEEELRRVAEAIMTSVSKMAEQAAQEKRERV
jgi:transcriptional regulator with XRE-family HTH domain